jgi:hypothetical protein
VRLAVGSRYKAIAFALGLAGAITACGGDDTVTGETGGSGGTSVSDSGKGGAVSDAANDRGDARVDAAGGAGGADATPDRGSGGVDASPDVTVVVDAARDVSPDVVVVADARPDAVVVSDASDSGPRPDVIDAGGGTPDVVSDRGPDVTPVPDAGPDVTAVSDAGPDTATVSDASDAAATADVAPEAEAAAPLDIVPGTLTWTPSTGTSAPSGDGGPLTWTAMFIGSGDSQRITASFPTTLNWNAYTTLVVHINVISGLASIESGELALQGDGDAGAENITEDPGTIGLGEQNLFLNITENPLVQAQVGSISLILNAVGDAGVTANPVVEILSIEAQP